jgi:hypothetical protein
VRDQVRAFPDEATINDWSPADRTKMLRRLEHVVGDHAEALMRVLLQLDAVAAEVRGREDGCEGQWAGVVSRTVLTCPHVPER